MALASYVENSAPCTTGVGTSTTVIFGLVTTPALPYTVIRTNVRIETFSRMASASTTTRVSRRSHPRQSVPATRFDKRLAEILTHATEVFCKKGYEGASMRDLSRASGMSLAGLYYYFESKERLLFLIQKHSFSTIVQRLKVRLEGVANPEERIRMFILNHLEYFLANQQSMKVLTHEAEALKNGFASEIAAIKREYYRICVGLLDDMKRDRAMQFSTRIAVLSLFGMMNWIYTWHNPRVDADAEHLANDMGDIFLRGVMTSNSKTRKDVPSRLDNERKK
jgi:TetR/AcrR family transcriptional regulator, cholesterol catabolism regulator